MSVSEELDSHTRLQIRSLRISWSSNREANISIVGASIENTSVIVTAEIDPLNLCNITYCMNSLIAATIPAALELISWRIKDRSLVDDQGAS